MTTPISLLASISDTSSVSARSAGAHGLGRHAAGLVRLDQRDREALLLELLAGVEHRLVLGARAHDVAAAAPARARGARHAEQRQVVGLGGAGGEDDLARRGADQRGDLGARRLDALLRRESRPVRGRGGIGLRVPGWSRHSAMTAATRGSTGVVAA